jgi:hypothetical protein
MLWGKWEVYILNRPSGTSSKEINLEDLKLLNCRPTLLCRISSARISSGAELPVEESLGDDAVPSSCSPIDQPHLRNPPRPP